MAIRCCNGCVAPKRYPGCHGKCPEYIKEKAEHNARIEEENKRKHRDYDLNARKRRYAAITRAVEYQKKCKEE